MTKRNDSDRDMYDLFVIGGGVNGCGIARDGAGRGMRVALAEMNDLASATSSASTKLFHGGLRYLEYFEFRLVREALREREVLLEAMPHIARPQRFVLPLSREMRFDVDSPASRLLARLLPWMRARRPFWMIRLGLYLYDHLGKRRYLPGTATLDLRRDAAGGPLQERYRKAFEYSDCTVDDSRLVVLNARDAADRGARIMTHTRVLNAMREGGHWRIVTEDARGTQREHRARVLVNAAGPWVSQVLDAALGLKSTQSVRLVRGSHIITQRLYEHERAYFFQGSDGRIVFAIPYESDFTLIGTTEAAHDDPDTAPRCTQAEKSYLLEFVSRYFKREVREADVVATYSGVRPLYDDGAASASAATRDYVLTLDAPGEAAPLLNVFGGKITTYRKLAEEALEKLSPFTHPTKGHWTAGVPLPGGAFPVDGVAALERDLIATHPFLDPGVARRLVRAYGTDAAVMLDGARTPGDLGQEFGAGVTARELDWTIRHEWVTCGEDFLWRRSRLGLHLDGAASAAIDAYIKARIARAR